MKIIIIKTYHKLVQETGAVVVIWHKLGHRRRPPAGRVADSRESFVVLLGLVRLWPLVENVLDDSCVGEVGVDEVEEKFRGRRERRDLCTIANVASEEFKRQRL